LQVLDLEVGSNANEIKYLLQVGAGVGEKSFVLQD
jgi:hypothetical protein